MCGTALDLKWWFRMLRATLLSTCHGIEKVRSSFTSRRSGNAGLLRWMRSCCRCMRREWQPAISRRISPRSTELRSAKTISRITDEVIAEIQDWVSRPLDAVYVAVFIDAIHVKVRDGQVANRPVYAAIGVTVLGWKDVLGLWMGAGGEGAKFWMSVLIDLKDRSVRDVFFLACDGLKGLPEAATNARPHTIVQTCIFHLTRNTFRIASPRDRDAASSCPSSIETSRSGA